MTVFSRYGPLIIWDKLRKHFERKLDPDRAARVFHEFDEVRGYRDYQEYCRDEMRRALPGDDPIPLTSTGFQRVGVMDPGEANQVLEDSQHLGTEGYLKRDSRKLRGYEIRDPQYVKTLMEQVLCAEVDELAVRFFRSEYLVHWYMVSRTLPAKGPPTVSFRWHCDKGPRSHLKILVYLTDAKESNSGTAFVDVAQTASLIPTGYLFGRGRRRTTSLEKLSQMAGAKLEAQRLAISAGEGVMFQPARVLHSGIAPDTGARFVLTVCLLPSPVGWRDALSAGTISDLTCDPLWHPHARELLHRLDSAQIGRTTT